MNKFLIVFLGLIVSEIGASRVCANELLIYSATDQKAIWPLVEEYQEKNPDTLIIYREFNTRELYDTIVSSKEPIPDIVISSAMDLQVKLVNDGFSQQAKKLSPTSYSNQTSWRQELFSFTSEPIVFVYNQKEFLNKKVPTTHDALAEHFRDYADFYDNRVGSYDVRSSGLGYLVGTQDQEAFSLTGRLQENLGRVHANVYCCTSELLDDIAAGDLVFGYNMLGSYALERAKSDPRLGVTLPEDYSLVISRSVFIHKRAEDVAEATRFVEFLLSDLGQSIIAKETGLLPLKLDALPEGYKSKVLNTETNFYPIKLGPELLVYLDNRKRIHFLKAWSSAVLR
ncbi:ABC transporter substrate-binding protein [Reinekea forsetii]|nr:ABC transporter substrate-binding protein [Reinekea forsetii]